MNDLPVSARILRGRVPELSNYYEIDRYSSSRPANYKQWTGVAMKKAVENVTVHAMSIREAAARFSVPKSTLGDRISGRVQDGAISGPENT